MMYTASLLLFTCAFLSGSQAKLLLTATQNASVPTVTTMESMVIPSMTSETVPMPTDSMVQPSMTTENVPMPTESVVQPSVTTDVIPMPTESMVQPSTTTEIIPMPTESMVTPPQPTQSTANLPPVVSVASTAMSTTTLTTSAETPTVEPSNQPTEPSQPTGTTPQHQTTAKPAPVKGRPNVGLAVGLTLLFVALITIVIVVAGLFIYKKFGRARASYEILPTEKE